MADRINDLNDDNVQHGIDDDPHNDGTKGLELGALGGGAVGAIAGLAAGPIGAIVGAIIGGTAGSIASGAAVDAVDSVDNDDTVTGIGGTDATYATTDPNYAATDPAYATTAPVYATDMPGNGVPGVQTGGMTTAGADTRGVMEKTADAITGDTIDDKTGGRVMDADMTGTAATTMGASTTAPVMGTPVMGTTTNADSAKIELAAEELHVNKTLQQTGEVSMHKEVIEEQVQVPVTLRREEVVITRTAVNRELAPGEMATDLGEDEVIRIPVSEEVANVSKTAHVVEEVEIGKRTVTEDQTVSGTVRHEEVDIDDSTKR